jgi:hypothetical protein
VVPIQRGLIDVMEPTIELLDSRPDLKEQFEAWSRDRSGFIKQLKDRDEEAVKQGWQKDYFKGKAADGSKVEEHQTKVNLKPFRRV